ncbi:MAG TPA: hypothetical protein VNO33_06955 [Kofleriaceae bacterium]|nr:hypothetical protein [Kofleriaceae bacterium]
MNAPRHGYAIAIALIAACGGGRTSPATQPSPAAFDAAASDPKAVAAVDQMLAALGGAAEWDKVKQIRWEQRYTRDGKMMALFRHAWDRWNARHRYEEVNLASMEKAKREGRPQDIEVTVGMYEIFDHQGKGSATHDGQMLGTEARDKIVASAFKAWQSDSYRLTAIYKVKDPGVKLTHKGVMQPVKEFCKPTCEMIEVSFAPEVGKDVWFIAINSQSKMPDVLEKQMPDGKLGFGLSGWTTVGALKFPTKFENLGMSESFEISDIKIGEPEDDLYIPTVGE